MTGSAGFPDLAGRRSLFVAQTTSRTVRAGDGG